MKRILIFLLLLVSSVSGFAQAPGALLYIANKAGAGYFPLAVTGKVAPVYVSNADYPGVKRAVESLGADLHSVTGNAPVISSDKFNPVKHMVIIGTLGKNELIDQLVEQKKLDVLQVEGKWEASLVQVVQKPFPGVESALIIAGSDKRGTIFGVYDLSAQIGVSPWYWWADVPVKQQQNLYVMPGMHSNGEPAVKYRGIFINDEAPAFSGWAKEKFGGLNHHVYEKVFELILRLKGNYLWPAMWGNAFNDDDKLNPVLADEYGIVMGTSHHEPMDRAQQEWKRYGNGEWNYDTNKTVLQNFWKKGIENMGTKETIVTVGMRGDGDKPMTEGSNIALLENIVKDQRGIISQVTGKDAAQTPQMWALYKEVQDYYDKGMRVPDDITLLLCDDNWGNIRKLPSLTEKPRKGGYGIYYHFDYVGGPRNYKWLNTNPISKTWEQMHLAYAYNARQVWIVNVGDLKPMEFPISFFLDYAWNPNKWPADRLQEYTNLWAKQQFGPAYATEIGQILSAYTKYNGRRKPELIDQHTYSLTNYNEFENIVADYNSLKANAEKLYAKLSPQYKDAYYQLVLHPVEACANLNELYFEAANNKWYAAQQRAATNTTAAKVKELFEKDKEISKHYNTMVANGKWNHMMDQTHIGYTYWQQPPVDVMPEVKELDIPDAAQMGVYVEGAEQPVAGISATDSLPGFYPWEKSSHYIEVFNKGKTAFSYTVQSPAPYVVIKQNSGKVTEQEKIWVSIDWAKVPHKVIHAPLTITALGKKVTVKLTINNKQSASDGAFHQNNGYIAIEAQHYSRAVNGNAISWMVLPGYGKTLSGVTTMPVTAKKQQPGGSCPHLEYRINLTDTGWVSLQAFVSPTIDFRNGHGLFYAVSIDNETPQQVNISTAADSKDWAEAVSDNIRKMITKHHITQPGIHTIKYWMVDAGVVLQKVVVDAGGLKPSYLGPPE
ncbi:glycosyl hydrolase 115 family protein [Mucilaginibacter sp. FT3.2]|uniref:glycosyl hydrolase 115 family protein n=1 Tax=Mucilaginibacter sp. FT3.2 TaxID=2723090 RepID=UPI00161F6ABD|nr:glycosyl hydrolase 115 family protein [Mucilaginibacter sp. FT3.2]MBB6229831.1 hypothetical protein [Mucilaginibacter sp. FT3.2]